jgi:uncharacterized membrane protein YkvA (DUF1232 family)
MHIGALKPPSHDEFEFIVGLVCLAYLAHPTAGILELIPDNIPFVGNLDDASATGILISCLACFGFDITRFARRSE